MIILKTSVILAFVICTSVLFLRHIEARTLFYPTREMPFLPDRAGLKFKNVDFLSSDNVRLNGWLIFSEGARYTVLFCHGNAGNISHRIEKLKFFHDLGCNVFIFDYRGYGLSAGRPSEEGFYKDVQAAYKYLLSEGIPDSAIIGYGESIGGAVIVDLACRNKMKAIILDSTFSSVKDMIKITYRFIPYWVFASRFDSFSKIRSLSVPKLIIHSLNDEIVPYRLGRKLFDAAAGPKDFLQIQGGHNSNFYESEDLLRSRISSFINSL